MKLSLNIESATALREFSKSMPLAVQNIVESTEKVVQVYQSVAEELGVHNQNFYDMLMLVKNAQEETAEAIQKLPKMLNNVADRIDFYVRSAVSISSPHSGTVFSENSSNASLFGNASARKTNNQTDKWNTEYMPLVQANIRGSVARLFSKYISGDKLESCLSALSFMDQKELRERYGRGFTHGTLGFNNGDSSNIALDMTGSTRGGVIGNHKIGGSNGMDINFAFVTAVHENLHMMSANDTGDSIKRGIMVNGDESSRAMNEAFTEYFTYLSCGGDMPLGGLYPGFYSKYTSLMQEMPKLEKAIGRDCMMDGYFNNNPQCIRDRVDALLNSGAWDDMCKASYDFLYNNNANDALSRLLHYFNELSNRISDFK